VLRGALLLAFDVATTAKSSSPLPAHVYQPFREVPQMNDNP
jgi:hypothetical protein